MKKSILCIFLCAAIVLAGGCSVFPKPEPETTTVTTTAAPTTTEPTTEEPTTEETTVSAKAVPIQMVYPDKSIRKITSNLSITSYSGDYGLEDYLAEGGAATNDDLFQFVARRFLLGNIKLHFNPAHLGCSTISVHGENGSYFGRNFDWNKCEAMIVVTHPKNGYSSVSTSNISFITSAANFDIPENILRFAAVYTPLDGMNEKGVCVSVNMINDSSTINQDTGRTNITTTTAIRLILDRAANVDEAVNILKKYDMHAAFNYNVHYAITDATGKAVAVEYIHNKLVVTETPALTNFYITPGDKYGTGSQESIGRYDKLIAALDKNPDMDEWEVRDALKSVSQPNSPGIRSTEWTAVFNRDDLTVTYYHRGNYSQGYKVAL